MSIILSKLRLQRRLPKFTLNHISESKVKTSRP